MAGLEKDTAGDMEVCTVLVAEICNGFKKDADTGDEEDTAFPGMFNHGFQGRMYGGSGMG